MHPLKQFKVNHLGEAKIFLGIHINRNKEKRTLEINQAHFDKEYRKQVRVGSCKAKNITDGIGFSSFQIVQDRALRTLLVSYQATLLILRVSM
eukprot:CAMPEP_0175043966 /NCGR_PEP_ID=MMETSP0052_2-20121109/3516_1 /TAXON_ID=51329 ORGANISM="Polytomella parva, Strain SAG 63-3" /NCGR_SAMPLE_ID=MMETSP0052_2 /ASSEMBLY_ACC=CAM_ASM_000194 /LENGTH=92 /DNA_ID=CAMNT_0016307155 /DNA_START=632 /DNA_END=910 /DNA_ORIENTATION=+